MSLNRAMLNPDWDRWEEWVRGEAGIHALLAIGSMAYEYQVAAAYDRVSRNARKVSHTAGNSGAQVCNLDWVGG
jgi:hypothetical protein